MAIIYSNGGPGYVRVGTGVATSAKKLISRHKTATLLSADNFSTVRNFRSY
jgi:hypothetical protein